jgi:NAD(P)-dependent dehydrogenase (short-subunit alcohol dehydrogenase family)
MPNANGGGKPGVFVTGALTGIGEATARYLNQRRFRVFAGVLESAAGNADGTDGIVRLPLDVTRPDLIANTAREVAAMTGDHGLQGLVNNAGIYHQAPLECLDLLELRRHLEVNLIGNLAVTQAFLPLLRRGRGRIVNVGSISGRLAAPLEGAYAASKFALEAVSDVLRIELRPYGIPVSILEPGGVATPMLRKAAVDLDAMLADLPAPAKDIYQRAAKRLGKLSQESLRTAMPPERVSRAIYRALTARSPRPRYAVGADARLLIALQAMPTRLRDRILARVAGLHRAI